MTQVDFHSKVPDKLNYACRLVRKARAAGMKVVLFAESRAQLTALDEMLWTFSEQDFLPHGQALPHHQVLVNVSRSTPEHFARFERMFEIVSTDEDDLLAGRERYKQYQQRGYPLTHHVADKT